MSRKEEETVIPDVIVKPGKMFSGWSIKTKIGVALITLAVYAYLVLFIKTVYFKNKKLEKIMSMAAETEVMLKKIHVLDQTLALQLDELANHINGY